MYRNNINYFIIILELITFNKLKLIVLIIQLNKIPLPTFEYIFNNQIMMNTNKISEEVDEDNQEFQSENNSSPDESDVKAPKGGKRLKNNPNICSNKICKSFKLTKYNQNNENNVENLCPDCIKQYEKQSYCLYCKQIYFDFTDDGKEWIMCDQCQRWVHTQCTDFYLNNNANANFNCIKCKKIQVVQNGNGIGPSRRNTNTSRISTSKVPERRKTQECMLNNFGFYWQLSPAELAEDVEKLKQFLK